MDTLINVSTGRKAQQLVDSCGRQELTTGQHRRRRHQPYLHVESVLEEEMEERSRIELANCLPGHESDRESDERERNQGNHQPDRICVAMVEVLRGGLCRSCAQ